MRWPIGTRFILPALAAVALARAQITGPGLQVSGISPSSRTAGAAGFTLTVKGTGFDNGNNQFTDTGQSQVFFGNTPLTTTFVDVNTLTAPVPASVILNPGQVMVIVQTPGDGSSVQNPAIFTVLPPPLISSLAPNSLSATAPGFTLVVGGANFLNGMTVLWNGVILPTTFVNPAQLTAIVAPGMIALQGIANVTVLTADGVSSNVSRFAINPPPVLPPQLRIVTPSPLTPGTVGVPYVAPFGASGGTGDYTFSGGGNLPPGLSVSSNGFLSGTPTTPGQYSFTIGVKDSAGNSAAKDFLLVIQPAPLLITTPSPLPDAPVNSPLSIKLAAQGGIPPYRFGATGSIPPGTSFAGDGTLSGTPNSIGAFAFRVTVTDNSNNITAVAAASKDFTINITPPALVISTKSPLSDAQVGTSYGAQFGAIGGVPPYTWSGSGAPDGLTFSANGALSGTPTTDGQFTLSVTVTDSAGAKATGKFSIKVVPATLRITGSLSDGVVNVSYSATLGASGGVKPYAFSISGLPDGVTGAADGSITGTPKSPGKFNVTASVKDAASATAMATFTITIAPPPLLLTTTSAPNGTVGSAYSTGFAASGGVPPYTFSAAGLPAGLSLSASGALSGTPAAAGTPSFTVTVKDSVGNSTSSSFRVTISLPATPPVTLAGLPDSINPTTQPRLQIGLGNAYPVDVTVTLTLTFTPDSGPGDPSVQFSTGGRTLTLVIPAGSTVAANADVQTGSTSGTISITARLQALGQDITGTPVPARTIRINATAPVITGPITATRTSTGFTVVTPGFSPSRELTQATFQFTPSPGASLQTLSLTVPIDGTFAPWYQGQTTPPPYGTAFTFTETFTVQGSPQSIASVTVTLANKVGTSAAVTANLQ